MFLFINKTLPHLITIDIRYALYSDTTLYGGEGEAKENSAQNPQSFPTTVGYYWLINFIIETNVYKIAFNLYFHP